MALVEAIFSSQAVKNRNTGAAWDGVDSHGPFMAVEMCAVAWGPIDGGCISDFLIFQLHLVLYQIVCIGPGNVTSPVFSEELCSRCLNDDT